MSEIYVVVGTPRSGTSMVAGILHKCGVPMAKTFYRDNAGDEWNPAGHFMDVEIHTMALPFIGSFDVPRLNWTLPTEFVPVVQQMATERSVSPKWGFKTVHAMTMARVLKSMGEDVRTIRTIRPIGESKLSYKNRISADSRDLSDTFVEGLKAFQDAAIAEWDGPLLTINHGDLYDNTQATVNTIAAFAGVDPTEEAVSFIDPAWRRY